MKSLFRILSLLLIIVFLISKINLIAQSQQQPKFYFVSFEKPLVDKVGEYETAQKYANEFAAKYEIPYYWTNYATEDDAYYYVSEIENLAEVDKITNLWVEVSKKAGKEAEKLYSGFLATVKKGESDVYMSSPELSYQPKIPRLKPEEIKFMKWYVFDIKPYQKDAASEPLLEIKAFYEKNDIDVGYDVFFKYLGGNMNTLVVSWGEKTREDFFSTELALNKKFGKEIWPIMEKFMKYVEDYKIIYVWYRADLSYKKK